MRNRLYFAAAVAALVIAALVAGWGARAQGPALKTWEYKVVTKQHLSVSASAPASLSERELNKLGDDGWELVETRSFSAPQGGLVNHQTDYFFKRLR